MKIDIAQLTLAEVEALAEKFRVGNASTVIKRMGDRLVLHVG
ncbi:MAG: hypothetical protein QXF56_05215 [Candidatus Micrarchaeia archaeon]